ncbi:hypothetical protein ACP70R_021274 [Stipagrostis hirtigluma subsp. patula]
MSFVVDGYSRTKDVPNGECIESRPFRVGGYRWIVEYYPNGKDPEDADSISLFLYLSDDNVLGTVKTYWGYNNFIEREALERSKHLKDDCFTIWCDIVVDLSTKGGGSDGEEPLMVVPPSDMHRHFGDLLRTKDGADVVFEVGGETFTAHRCVLAARSTIFKAQLFGSKKNVATASIIRIDDMETEIDNEDAGGQDEDDEEMEEVEAEQQQEEKQGDDRNQQGNTGINMVWQNLLVAADRYDLQRLKLICGKKLWAFMDKSTVTTLLVLAEQYHCQELKEACLNFLKSPANLQAVMAADGLEHVTRTCPSVLKELLAKFASQV